MLTYHVQSTYNRERFSRFHSCEADGIVREWLDVDAVVVPILRIGTLRHRELKWLMQVSRKQLAELGLQPGSLAPKPPALHHHTVPTRPLSSRSGLTSE